MTPSRTVNFVTAYCARTNDYQVGIVTSDGRCRIDTQGDAQLEEYTLWETTWNDPENPWKGGKPHTQVFGLDNDYT